jgi:sugar phosphate permease
MVHFEKSLPLLHERRSEDMQPKSRFFYGWVIVLLAALTQAVSFGQLYLNGILIVSFREMFKVSNQQIFLATTGLMTITYGIASALFGVLAHKYKLRVFAVVIYGCMAVGYLCLSLVSHVWHIALIYGVLFGIGQLGLPVAQTMIAHWFIARRGMAFGLAACGFAVPGFLGAPAMAFSIHRFGFSHTMLGYGCLILLFIPLVLRYVIDWPEELGLAPDGQPAVGLSADITPEKKSGRAIASLLPSPLFWLVAIIITLTPLIVNQLITYFVPMAKASGVDIRTASLFMSRLALAALAAKLVVGWLADRIPLRMIAALPPLGCLLACLLLIEDRSSASFALASLLLGAGGGASGVMIPVVVSKTFGRADFGAIIGLSTPLLVVQTLFASWGAGHVVDATGGYRLVLMVFAALAIIGCLLVGPLPGRRLRPTPLAV